MARKILQLSLLSCILAGCCAYMVKWCLETTFYGQILTGLLALVTGLVCLVCLDMIYLGPADSHSFRPMLLQYMLFRMTSIVGPYYNYRLNKEMNNCRGSQEKTLMKWMVDNKDTEFGRKYGFKDIKSREQFRARLPLSTYSDYADYIERMAAGERNILIPTEVGFFSMTSGTTGKNKLYPTAAAIKTAFMPMYFGTIWKFTFYSHLQRHFSFRLYPPARYTAGGIPCGSQSVYSWPPPSYNTTPNTITKIYQEKPAFYLQALFLLAERELAIYEGFSSNLVYAFFKYIETNWNSLCYDIQHGTYKLANEISDELFLEFKNKLPKDPARADELRQEYKKGMVGLALRLWPGLKAACVCSSGSFEHCANLLQDTYMKGVSFSNFAHGASEGVVGINVGNDGKGDTFQLSVGLAFFEFIPIEEVENEIPKVLYADQLETGQLYEVVITSAISGLYRYRLGDVIKVVDNRNGQAAPHYKFQYRLGQVLNIAFDRTPESLVYQAVTRTEEQWRPIKVLDFTSTESMIIEKITGERSPTNQYVIFVELNTDEPVLTKKHAHMVDSTLSELHEPYQVFRKKGSIDCIQLYQVKQGAFKGLTCKLWGDYQNQQFKMPRVLRRQPLLEHLLGEVITSAEQAASKSTIANGSI